MDGASDADCIRLSRSYMRALGHLVYKQNIKLLRIVSERENIPFDKLMLFLEEHHRLENLSNNLLNTVGD